MNLHSLIATEIWIGIMVWVGIFAIWCASVDFRYDEPRWARTVLAIVGAFAFGVGATLFAGAFV